MAVFCIYFRMVFKKPIKLEGTRTCHAPQWPTPPSDHNTSTVTQLNHTVTYCPYDQVPPANTECFDLICSSINIDAPNTPQFSSMNESAVLNSRLFKDKYISIKVHTVGQATRRLTITNPFIYCYYLTIKTFTNFWPSS